MSRALRAQRRDVIEAKRLYCNAGVGDAPDLPEFTVQQDAQKSTREVSEVTREQQLHLWQMARNVGAYPLTRLSNDSDTLAVAMNSSALQRFAQSVARECLRVVKSSDDPRQAVEAIRNLYREQS